MSCETVRPLLQQHLDGYLPDDEAKPVKVHLASCERCRESFERLKGLRNELGALDRLKAPSGFKSAVMDRIAQGREDGPGRAPAGVARRLFRLQPLGFAAAVVAVGLTAYLVYLSTASSPRSGEKPGVADEWLYSNKSDNRKGRAGELGYLSEKSVEKKLRGQEQELEGVLSDVAKTGDRSHLQIEKGKKVAQGLGEEIEKETAIGLIEAESDEAVAAEGEALTDIISMSDGEEEEIKRRASGEVAEGLQVLKETAGAAPAGVSEPAAGAEDYKPPVSRTRPGIILVTGSGSWSVPEKLLKLADERGRMLLADAAPVSESVGGDDGFSAGVRKAEVQASKKQGAIRKRRNGSGPAGPPTGEKGTEERGAAADQEEPDPIQWEYAVFDAESVDYNTLLSSLIETNPVAVWGSDKVDTKDEKTNALTLARVFAEDAQAWFRISTPEKLWQHQGSGMEIESRGGTVEAHPTIWFKVLKPVEADDLHRTEDRHKGADEDLESLDKKGPAGKIVLIYPKQASKEKGE